MKAQAAQVVNEREREAQRAKWRRANHANIEAMQNLIVSAVAEETGEEMPQKVRLLISAIQGAHGGGQVVNEEFSRSYLALADQLQFTGTDEARRARVRDWINALEEWQRKTYLLISVTKGGEIVGSDEGGEPLRAATKFIDLVKPIADEAVMRARNSALWREHPGKALAAQVAWAVSQLSRHPEYTTPGEARDGDAPEEKSGGFTISEYVKSREDKLLAEERRITDKLKSDEPTDVDEIDARIAALEVHYARVRKQLEAQYESTRAALLSLRDSRCRRAMDFTDPERVAADVDARIAEPKPDGPPASWLDEALGDTQARHSTGVRGNGYYYTRDFFDPSDGEVDEPIGERGGKKNLTLPPDETRINTEEKEPDLAQFALGWARLGVPVFPLHSVFDGICSCPEGSECKSKGKHPMTARGLKNATTDETTICRWWAKHPHANIGGVTGGALRLLAVDVDPKNGGDANLCNLVEAHGAEWLDTFTQETGSRGSHILFTYPAGVELRNSAGKIAVGIDTRAEGGYIVLAPSLHALGRRYAIANEAEIAPAPDWLIDDLTRKPSEPTAKVIDFQERRASLGGGVIGEGERNDRLFRVGCGIWGSGGALDKFDLYSQLLEVNSARVSPSLAPSEVVKIAESVARYPRGVPIQEGAAV